jgi:hypothetical protein
MILKKNLLFLSIGLFFGNAYAMNGPIKYVNRVYRNAGKLYRVVHAGEFKGTPIITYQEVQKNTRFLSNTYKPIEPSIYWLFKSSNTVEEETFINMMRLHDTNCVFK